MPVETWSQYVRKVVGPLKQEQVAEAAGISQATVSSWLRGAPAVPRAETVIAFARSFGQPPIEALVSAGYIDDVEAEGRTRTPLSEYSDADLLTEVKLRMAARQT